MMTDDAKLHISKPLEDSAEVDVNLFGRIYIIIYIVYIHYYYIKITQCDLVLLPCVCTCSSAFHRPCVPSLRQTLFPGLLCLIGSLIKFIALSPGSRDPEELHGNYICTYIKSTQGGQKCALELGYYVE